MGAYVVNEVLVEHAKARIRARYPHAFVWEGRRVGDRSRCFSFKIHPFTRYVVGRPADTVDGAWFQAFALLSQRGQI